MEIQINGSLTSLTQHLGPIDPRCVDTYYRYLCSTSYPNCANIAQLRKNPHVWVNSDFFFDSFEANATGIDISAIPTGTIFAECPSPFLRDPLADISASSDPLSCRFGCCIPCPYQNFFYYRGWFQHAYMATDIVRTISAVCALFIVISFLVLPNKRSRPSLLILNTSVAVFLYSFPAVFSLGDATRIQCANEIQPSTQDNNKLCAAQGSLLLFGSMATVTWCAALIVNLHLHTVWNLNFFQHRFWLLHLLCWGIPATFMSVCLGLHVVEYVFTNMCLVALDHVFHLFFYPMAIIVCPAFLLHIVTFLYIARVAFREGIRKDELHSLSSQRHMMQAVQIQWRALLLAVMGCVTVITYMLRQMTEVDAMLHVLDEWIACMLDPTTANQDACVAIVAPIMPPLGILMAAEVIVSVIGILIFIIFAKRSLFVEWNDLIFKIRVSIGGRGHGNKRGEQFYQL
ncbi:hypothetical protein BC940DRAFT_358161 [Gongronella butleri]|nr:hypothetical protein BC940DRAFT_358161 [Gongronella butleri]